MDELPLFSRWSADKHEEDGGPEGREIAARDEGNFQAPDVTSATATPQGPVGHENFPCLHPNSTPPPFWDQFLYWPGTDSTPVLSPVSLTLFLTFNSLFINLFIPSLLILYISVALNHKPRIEFLVQFILFQSFLIWLRAVGGFKLEQKRKMLIWASALTFIKLLWGLKVQSKYPDPNW